MIIQPVLLVHALLSALLVKTEIKTTKVWDIFYDTLFLPSVTLQNRVNAVSGRNWQTIYP
jgi:hypothetical protein